MPSGWKAGRLELGYPATTPTEWLLLKIVRGGPPKSLRRLQPKAEMDDGSVAVYSKGVDIGELTFNLRMTTSEKDALETFLKTKSDFSAVTVWAKDPYGTVHTVCRIMNDDFNPEERAHDQWRWTIKLRKE